VKWNWDPRTWRTATRLLLGVVTIWPIIYIGLFLGFIFSGFLYGAMTSRSPEGRSMNIDLIQLERKIQSGEIAELHITAREIEAIDNDGRSFKTYVSNESIRDDILKQARELGPNNLPKVPKIDENSSQSHPEYLFLVGFAVLFMMHILTMLLMLALIPLYIILALKDVRHDQNTRIIWVVLIALVGILADLVYWYLYVWREPSAPVEPVPSAA
jgi:FtsH-like protein